MTIYLISEAKQLKTGGFMPIQPIAYHSDFATALEYLDKKRTENPYNDYSIQDVEEAAI